MDNLQRDAGRTGLLLAAALAACLGAGEAGAQLLGGGGGIGGGGPGGGALGGGLGGGLGPGPGGALQTLPGALERGTGALGNRLDGTLGAADALSDRVTSRAGQIVRDTVGRPADVARFDSDPAGRRVVYDEVLVLAPSAEALSGARALGFESRRRDDLASLGLTLVTLRVPRGMGVAEALAAYRQAVPGAVLDFNHVYDPSGEADPPPAAAEAAGEPCRQPAEGLRVGIVDAGVDRRHPALRGAEIVAANLAGSGAAPPTPHGTAVASALVGDAPELTGALAGATLYAADVFGGEPAGGSADAVLRGLAWLAERDVPVINVSLAGPPNRMLEAAVAALVARGHVLVGAAGNEGPARPIAFPAAYPGAVAVTAVDKGRAVQFDANRGPELAFAALGVGVELAGAGEGYRRMTGTSFAAPLVAARFAREHRRPDPAGAQAALARLRAAALDLGAPGRDPVFGHGFLACAAEARPRLAGGG